ncbi:MAG: HAMP domain-containing protein [Deltaproteobacteria bacterium]|nr:HAMP domain-containing protein [Deltaproteobacteria bacterium]
MPLGVRGKLFGLALLLIAVAGLAAGLYLEHALRPWLETRTEAELTRLTAAARLTVETLPAPATTATLQPVAERLARAVKARVTVIDRTGRVLADSGLSPRALSEVESHRDRPEVLDATRTGRGLARRYSHTLHTELLYEAQAFSRPDARGVVRLAMPHSEVEELATRLRRFLLAAGLLALLAAALMSAVSSHLFSRTLRTLVESARALASGSARRVTFSSTDELGRLAGSFNRLAEELERALTSLAGERDRAETILDAMEEGVLVLDAAGRLLLANPAARRLLALPPSAVGLLLAEVVRAPALHALLEAEPRVARRRAELELLVPSGPPARRVLAQVTPLRATSGTLVVLHDVTEIRRLEAVRRDFVANVSHELRTPVSVIRANAELLLDGALEQPDGGRRLAEALGRNAERLSRLVADLLDLARLEAREHPLELARLALAPAARKAIDTVETLAADKQLTLAVEIADGVEVLADASALDQVLLNLVDNAVKYTSNGGRIVLRARTDETRDAEVRLEIVDDGPGIEAQHRERVFERFYRVDAGRSRELGGTGLGLAIVKHLVEAQGGRVGVEPVAPHGCCFWVVLRRPEETAPR